MKIGYSPFGSVSINKTNGEITGSNAFPHTKSTTKFYELKVADGVYKATNKEYYEYTRTSSTPVATTSSYECYAWSKQKYVVQSQTVYSRGTFIEYIQGQASTYTNNAKNGSYWYVRDGLMEKYKLYKYDANLNFKSVYDVDSKVITTAAIDISDRDDEDVKMKIAASGTTYSAYISNDNSTWTQVTGISNGVDKVISVDGWDTLYIKIETSSSTINGITVSY